MAKMIDPDKLKKILEDRHLSTGKQIQLEYAMDEATVEVPEIIRCRDCRYSDKYSDGDVEHEMPLKCLDIRYGGVMPEWYCEHGKRKDAPTCGKDVCDL